MVSADHAAGNVRSSSSGRRSAARAVWWPGLVVALGAAVATAHGLYEVAVAARVPGGIAWLYPLITDGLALVAYTATARLTTGAARYAWTIVITAAGLSGLAQAVYLASDQSVAAPAVLRFGVGAWPAIAAAIAAHLLHLLTGSTNTTDGQTLLDADASTDPRNTPLPPGGPSGGRGVQPSFTANSTPNSVQADLGGVFNPPVQPDLRGPRSEIDADPGDRSVNTPLNTALNTAGAGLNTDPGDRSEPRHEPPGGVAGRSRRERAQTLAVRHAQRHGAWPTVSGLESLAAVSRGTAAAVLKTLRHQPLPLHLIPGSEPDPDDEQNGENTS